MPRVALVPKPKMMDMDEPVVPKLAALEPAALELVASPVEPEE
jgi:hypothetical protein